MLRAPTGARAARVTVPRSDELPPLEGLRCFVAAAEALNFRAAARLVGLTPAAVGQRIAALEAQLAAPLFTRTTRSVALTQAGHALLPYAQRALESARACAPAARGELGPAPLELTLGTRHELGMSWLVPQLDALARALPQLTLHLYFGSGEDLLLRVRLREVDAAITSTRFVDPRLDALALHREEYALVAAPSLLRRCPLRDADDAPAHTLLDINLELPLLRYLREAPDAPDLRFGRVLRRGSIAAIAHAVERGEGVAVLPRYFVQGALRARRLRRVLPAIALAHDYFRLVFRADDPRRGRYEALAEQLRRAPLR